MHPQHRSWTLAIHTSTSVNKQKQSQGNREEENLNLEMKSSFSASKPVNAWRFPTFDVTIPAIKIDFHQKPARR